MLCPKCHIATRKWMAWGALPKENRATVWVAAIHETHHTFFKGVLQGCLICSCIWSGIPEADIAADETDAANAIVTSGDKNLQLLKELSQRRFHAWIRAVGTLQGPSTHEEAVEKSGSQEFAYYIHRDYYYSIDRFRCSLKVSAEKVSLSKSFRLLGFANGCSIPLGLIPSQSHSRSICTSATSQLWRRWTHQCLETHAICKSLVSDHEFSPSRLIEVIADPGKADHQWRLVESNGQVTGAYVTLSHCWGTTLHTRLTGETMEDFLRGRPVSVLPKTYRDAMIVTLSLGLSYIWIDSLCIIQDDRDDWETQSTVMGLIYKHAICNIAATWADDGSRGCFSFRDSATITPTAIEFPYSGPAAALPQVYVVTRDANLGDDIESAPLNRRGWVLQERYMALRQLNFAADQVSWECAQLVASEEFPDGFPPSDSVLLNLYTVPSPKPRLSYSSELELRRAWTKLVEIYSLTNLTVFTDKMIAIAGLAMELRQRLDDVYLAGMWKKDLVRQLCWQNRSPPTSGTRYSRVDTYLAPTWSWASTPRGIRADDNFRSTNTGAVFLAEVLDATVTSRHSSGLHSFDFGAMQIRAIAAWVQVDLQVKNPSGCVQTVLGFKPAASHPTSSAFARIMNTGNSSPPFIYVIYDETTEQRAAHLGKEASALTEHDYLVVFVSATDWTAQSKRFSDVHLKGLILAPTDNEGEFVRVAMFHYSHPCEEETKPLVLAIQDRLSIPPGSFFDAPIDLSDPRLADMVQTVTVI
ncbi:heterokaryon incompatibility protein-domain-containing protein [Echria macrotheca]|uniref:Heterokaryon incompatibility protein-domain-containing protein n=1 Tax=Echria macrotheca TaxID=438768 RepID=A0AAJ0F7U3_9PEZI|nr:heterokaryon incompatibility protein-domain-containing protein [Echria macrotheca]